MVNHTAVELQNKSEKEVLLFTMTVSDAQALGNFNFSSPKLDIEKLTLRFQLSKV